MAGCKISGYLYWDLTPDNNSNNIDRNKQLHREWITMNKFHNSIIISKGVQLARKYGLIKQNRQYE